MERSVPVAVHPGPYYPVVREFLSLLVRFDHGQAALNELEVLQEALQKALRCKYRNKRGAFLELAKSKKYAWSISTFPSHEGREWSMESIIFQIKCSVNMFF